MISEGGKMHQVLMQDERGHPAFQRLLRIGCDRTNRASDLFEDLLDVRRKVVDVLSTLVDFPLSPRIASPHRDAGRITLSTFREPRS